MKKIRLIFMFSLIAISLVFTITYARAENVVNDVESSVDPSSVETEDSATNDTVSDDTDDSATGDSSEAEEATSKRSGSASSDSKKTIDEILKNNREKFQAETKNKIKENSDQTEDTAGNQKNKSKLSEAKKSLIKTRYKLRWQRVTARLNAANNRLEKIITKIDKKLTKMNEAGINTAEFEPRVVKLKTDLAALESEYQLIVSGYQNAVNQEDPKAVVKKVHQDIETFIKNIKALHAELMQLVTDMRQSIEDNTASGE